MERLREYLGIDRWVVVGGSWGTTLGLVYAERYPDRVSGIMVSAISTTRRSEIDWLYRGLARFFPEAWHRFRDGAGDAGWDGDLVAAYAALMNDPDPQVRNQAAATWRWWEDVVLSLEPDAKLPAASEPPDSGVLAFVRLTTHYYSHAGWLDDQAVIRDAGRLAGIPGVLIHGRLDLSCPIDTAWELAHSWPGSELLIDDHSGHRGSAAKRAWMLETLDQFARR
jgi:proline iminopeptidase